MSATNEIKKLVGQLFTVGFSGYSVPDEIVKAIEDFHLGGVIYFKKNVQSPGQLVEMANDIQFKHRPKDCPPLIIAIDHEGGRVNRLVKPFTKFPGNDHLGELGSPKVGFEFGRVLGKELKAVGINVNFAPVVDVQCEGDSAVLRSRTFSADPEVCARMGSAVARGIQKMGVMAVAKHFPGHGSVKEDSHHKLPEYEKSIEEMRKLDLIPFSKLIRSRVEGVMTAHILNKSLDSQHPSTLSTKTIDILRKELRFSKILFSDDMEMKAITERYPVADAAVLAVQAGVDNLIYRGGSGFPMEAFEAIVHAVEKKTISIEHIKESVARLERSKKSYASLSKPIEVTEVGSFIGLPEHFKLADFITKKELPPEDFA